MVHKIKDSMVGRKIVNVRLMTDSEMESEGWSNREKSAVIVLDDGSKIFASRDYEGNDAGALFGMKGRQAFVVYPEKKKE